MRRNRFFVYLYIFIYMKQKICKVCGTTDNLIHNRKYCKPCLAEYDRNRVKIYDEKHKDKQQIYYLNNKEKINKKNNEYKKNKYATDPLYRLKHNTRVQIKKCLIKQGYSKRSKTFDILGCTYEEFKIYIESKFESWMSWDNYGKYEKNTYNFGWDIDHIIPTSTATNETELYNLFHYTNLQPLCSKVNRDIKKDNI